MVRSALTNELDATTLYAILRLRSEVFVVEQACAYLDPDGRDVEPACRQLWIEEGDRVVATGRLLDGSGDKRIGRLCTAPGERSRGLASALLLEAIALAGPGPIVIDAQSHLAGWYSRFGFVATGREFVEDDIAHTEMRRS